MSRISLRCAIPFFLSCSVSLAQQSGEAAPVVLDVQELTERYRRLEEAGLLAAPEPRVRRPRPMLALPKEPPRPGQLVRAPKSFVAGPAPRASLLENAAVSPNTPRSLSGFASLDDNLTAIPPDTHGAVGRSHLMTVLNSEVLIQDRQGRRLSRVILEDFWRAHSPVEIAFDPRIAYDPRNDRWVFCVLTEPESSNNALYVGVSQTGDPTGRWNLYRFTPDVTSTWMDFPTMAINGPWVLITVNNYSLTTGRYVRATVFAMTAQDLYQGRGRFRAFADVALSAPVTDVVSTGTRPASLASAYDDDTGGEGVIRISEVRGEVGAETFVQDVVRLRVPQPWRFSAGEVQLGPQLGTNLKLDLGDDRMQQCVFRAGTIWCVHNIFLPTGSSPSRGGVQWLEISSDGNSTYRLTRHGRLEDPTGETMYAYPAIAVNRNNDVLMGYSRFSAQQYASANFSFRAGADPVGQFQTDSVLKQGEGPFRQRGRTNRWGDYSVAQVDPVDDLTLWTLQEYAGSPTTSGVSRWATWWGAVTPNAAACSFTVSQTTVNLSNQASAQSLNIGATAGDCRWMAAPNVPWITVAAGSPGMGSGAVTLNVTRNTATAERRGTVTIAGREVTVVQLAGPAAPDLVVTALNAPTTGTLGRPLNATSELRNAGTLPAAAFRLGFFLSRRPAVTTADTYTGTFCEFPNGLLAGQVATCNGAIQIPGSLTPGTYYLAAIADFENRLTLAARDTTTRNADSGPIALQVSADAPALAARGVTHGANGLASTATPVISPGQVVVIYGQRFGGTELVAATVTNGRFPTTISGTSVLFDGVAAPLLYVAPTQLAVMAPFALNLTRGTTNVQIVSGGLPSETVGLPVVGTSPGFFTTNFSGTGAVACLNQNSSVNTSANPAERGTVVQLYGTGFGALNPALADGVVAGVPLAQLRETLRVEIGGRVAQVLYAGAAPGLVAGVVQINVVVPADATTGASPIRVFMAGDVFSRAGTTVFVR